MEHKHLKTTYTVQYLMDEWLDEEEYENLVDAFEVKRQLRINGRTVRILVREYSVTERVL